MKKIALAVVFAGLASTAFAGGMAEPVMAAEPIVEEAATGSSAGGLIVPMILIALIAAAVAA